MVKVTGLVLEVAGKDCLVLGPGNEYVRVALPKQRPQPGDIIESYRLGTYSLANRPVSRVWAYVASILITLMLGGYKVYADTLAPTAYVSVDMAPSIELVLNSKGKVVRTKSYNAEGTNLLRGVTVDDQPVSNALQSLITKALEGDSTVVAESDTIIITYTPSPFINGADLNRDVAAILEQNHFTGQLLSQSIDRKFRAKAAYSELSPGQQLILDLAESNNVTIPIEDLKKQDMPKFLHSHNLKLDQLAGSAPNNQALRSPDLIQIGPKPAEPKVKPAEADSEQKVSQQTKWDEKFKDSHQGLPDESSKPDKASKKGQQTAMEQVASAISVRVATSKQTIILDVKTPLPKIADFLTPVSSTVKADKDQGGKDQKDKNKGDKNRPLRVNSQEVEKARKNPSRIRSYF